jgi:deoxyribonuclease (pyrimidine dimer)
MVRVNLIKPIQLSDQHLIAEYNEILMLLGYVKKYPLLFGIPRDYCLGKGHILFFKNKIGYLKKRHDLLKIEMKKRGFKASKTINLSKFKKELVNHWKPSEKDFRIIKKRISWKLRKKRDFYCYYGKKKNQRFFLNLLKAKI